MTVTTPNTVSPLSSSMASSSSSSTSTCCMSTHKQNISSHCSHLISPHYKHNQFQANVARLLPNISSAKPMQDTWFSPTFSISVSFTGYLFSQNYKLLQHKIILFMSSSSSFLEKRKEKKEQVKLLYSSYTEAKAQRWLLNWEWPLPGFSIVD